MGYVPGKGLGKTESGISEPIQQSMHKGRRGLGHMIAKLKREDVQWELEEVRQQGRSQDSQFGGALKRACLRGRENLHKPHPFPVKIGVFLERSSHVVEQSGL